MANYYRDAKGRRRRVRSSRAGIIPAGLKDAAVDEAEEIAREVVAILHSLSDPRLSGHMLRSYAVERDTDGVRIVNPVHYWIFQEFGTRTWHGTEWTPETGHVRAALDAVRASRRRR